MFWVKKRPGCLGPDPPACALEDPWVWGCWVQTPQALPKPDTRHHRTHGTLLQGLAHPEACFRDLSGPHVALPREPALWSL